ncbi:MAG: LCP family protein [Bacillota bacterium]
MSSDRDREKDKNLNRGNQDKEKKETDASGSYGEDISEGNEGERNKERGRREEAKGDTSKQQEAEEFSAGEQKAGSEPGATGEGIKRSGPPKWFDNFEGAYDPEKTVTKKKMSLLKKALIAVAGIIVLSLVGAGAYVMAFYEDVQEPQRVLLDEVSFEQEHDRDVEAAFSGHTVNIALLGFDSGWGRESMGEKLFRPDMLAVIAVDLEEEEVSLVRIPRDAYVPIHGRGGGHDKINHSYFYGYNYGGGEDQHQEGINYTLQTVSNVLGGIPIHYYISVDMYSVIELVDAVGGIYYEVDETIYDEHWEIGRVLVPEGPQIMDGKTYLRYLQYRGETGDKTRDERQFDLLEATFVHLKEEGKITDLPAVYRIYKDYVETDLNYTQITALAYFAKDLNLEEIDFHILPGSGQTKDGIWYEVLNQTERVRIIEEVFGIEAERWAPIVLEDSEEYLEEQEGQGREEEREKDEDEDDDWPFDDRDDEEEEEVEEKVAVPQLRGMSAQDAESALQDKGLQVGSIIESYDDELEAGLVLHSEPPSGEEAEPGAIVNLVVSKGPEPVEENNANDGDSGDNNSGDQ